MCEMDEKRQKTISILGLKIAATQILIEKLRYELGGLKVKDIEVLDKLDAAMSEAVKYLTDELEGPQ